MCKTGKCTACRPRRRTRPAPTRSPWIFAASKIEAEPAEQGGDNFRTGSALANRLVLRYERFANNGAYIVGLLGLPGRSCRPNLNRRPTINFNGGTSRPGGDNNNGDLQTLLSLLKTGGGNVRRCPSPSRAPPGKKYPKRSKSSVTPGGESIAIA